MSESPAWQDGFEVTHGICQPCTARVMQELKEPLLDYLDSLGMPVMVIQSDPAVFTANKYACTLLGKERQEIEGSPGGDVLECIHGFEPGGCGNTVHCKTCTIRNTILNTFTTGRSCTAVPAYPDIQFFDKVKTMSIAISTERVGQVVFLRIDEFSDTPGNHGQ